MSIMIDRQYAQRSINLTWFVQLFIYISFGRHVRANWKLIQLRCENEHKEIRIILLKITSEREINKMLFCWLFHGSCTWILLKRGDHWRIESMVKLNGIFITFEKLLVWEMWTKSAERSLFNCGRIVFVWLIVTFFKDI